MKKLSLHTRIHYLQCKSFGLGFLYSITRNRLFFDKKIRAGIVLIALMMMLTGCGIEVNAQNQLSKYKTALINVKKTALDFTLLCYAPPAIEKRNDSINQQKMSSGSLESETHDMRSFTIGTQRFTIVEESPEFPGGYDSLALFIKNHLIYPQIALDKKIEGRVITQFVVERNGSITEVQVVHGISPELDTEAIRIVHSMPKWDPGLQRNKPLRVKYTLPIGFKLPATEELICPVEEMPEFPGGNVSEFIEKHLIYPENAKAKGIQGRVITQFVVHRNGSISDVQVVRGISPELDKEAIRIIKSMPKWLPAREHNIPVRVKYTLPVNFKLPNANP